ncbi:hypothetical protein MTO96_023031 [Rhipicephalus appendiculatus]
MRSQLPYKEMQSLRPRQVSWLDLRNNVGKPSTCDDAGAMLQSRGLGEKAPQSRRACEKRRRARTTQEATEERKDLCAESTTFRRDNTLNAATS